MIDRPVIVSSKQARAWIARLQKMPVSDAMDRYVVEAELDYARHLLEKLEKAGL